MKHRKTDLKKKVINAITTVGFLGVSIATAIGVAYVVHEFDKSHQKTYFDASQETYSETYKSMAPEAPFETYNPMTQAEKATQIIFLNGMRDVNKLQRALWDLETVEKRSGK